MEKNCATCDQVFMARWPRCRFCSRGCKAKFYNALRTPGHKHICNHCGDEYRTHEKDQKYCSKRCAGRSRPAPRKTERSCVQCGAPFSAHMSNRRKFCSYRCHLDSGGALRAGQAATAMRTMSYGAKKDANHKEVIGALEAGGACVLDLSTLGYGAPDLFFWCGWAWHAAEIKNPKTSYGRRGLNKMQREWAERWKGAVEVLILRSGEEAIQTLNRLRKGRQGPALPPDIASVETPEQAIAEMMR